MSASATRGSDTWAARHVSFRVRPGERVAFVGENGAGKTTLTKLMARLYEPTEGRIYLEGVNQNSRDTRSSHAAILEAAEQSQAVSLLDRLPGGYRQMLGRRFQNGVELSGGEWQKIALARAYIRKASIVILDEPTAALDARAEYEVFSRFSDPTSGRIAILISHRFSTVRMAERIIVLQHGSILEQGTHEQLVANSGLYAELFSLQAEGYR